METQFSTDIIGKTSGLLRSFYKPETYKKIVSVSPLDKVCS